MNLRELDFGLWSNLAELYSNDPLTHVYLIYDLVYELEKTDVYFSVVDGSIEGYLLVWRGPRRTGIHIWGEALGLLEHVPGDRELIVQVHERKLLRPALDLLKGRGEVRVREHLNMVVVEDEFKPYMAEKATRLRAGDTHH